MVSRASVAPFERMRTMYMVRQADGRSLGMGGEPLSRCACMACISHQWCHERWDPLHSARRSAGCAKKIYKEGGMAALFKGNFATMVKVAPQTAIQFAVSLLACVAL